MKMLEAIREYKELLNHREQRTQKQAEAITTMMEEGAYDLAKQFITVIEKNDTDVKELWEQIKTATESESE